MRCLAIAAVLWLAACEREPSFDERYDAAQDQIEAKAAELDEAVERSASDAPQTPPTGDGN